MRYGAILSLLLAVPCWSQTTTTAKADTSGPCSPANTGSNNNFTINCKIGTQQGEKMLLILNKIIKNQLDPSEVMSKLDDIASGVREIQRRTGDRGLSETQVTTLVQTLGRSPQSISAVLLGDREANAYGQQIIQALTRAGWKVTVTQIGILGPPAYGVLVAGSAELTNSMTAAGIEVVNVNQLPANATILIGLKPY